jgi:hypothetical protein
MRAVILTGALEYRHEDFLQRGVEIRFAYA